MEDNRPKVIDLNKISQNLRTYLLFVKLIEIFSENAEEYEMLVHPAAEFTELPNLLNKTGQKRTREESRQGLKKGRMLLSEQNFQIVGAAEAGDRVVVEKIWTGRLAIDVGSLKKDQEITAHICAVVEFKDGKIFRHRSYDCYEPFG